MKLPKQIWKPALILAIILISTSLAVITLNLHRNLTNTASISQLTESQLKTELEFLTTDEPIPYLSRPFTLVTPENPGIIPIYVRNTLKSPITVTLEYSPSPSSTFKTNYDKYLPTPKEPFPYDEIQPILLNINPTQKILPGQIATYKLAFLVPKNYSGKPSRGTYIYKIIKKPKNNAKNLEDGTYAEGDFEVSLQKNSYLTDLP